MNSEQVQALNRVLAHFGHDEVKHYREAGEPSGHIAESILVVKNYMQHRTPVPNGEHAPEHPHGQASPIGIVRDHPSHDEDLSIEHLIIWGLLPLAKLPDAVANLVRDAVHGNGPEHDRATLAAIDAIASLRRDPDSEIPF